jgi:hypothetical protein
MATFSSKWIAEYYSLLIDPRFLVEVEFRYIHKNINSTR